MSNSPTIFVDADACPVKGEVYRVAARYGLTVFVVANSFVRVPQDPAIGRILVDSSFDAADNWIVEHISAGDVVVTSDIVLADRCLKAGAATVPPSGKPFTEASIGMALAMRDLMADLRAMGDAGGDQRPFSPRDRSAFLRALDETVNWLKRMAR